MPFKFAKLIILVFTALLTVVSCSNSDDGPMDLSPDGQQYTGKGFYLGAEIDSSRRYHLVGDTLFVRLDSLWTLTRCHLNSLDLVPTVSDSVLHISFDVQLRSVSDALCAATLFVPDTLVKVPWQNAWNNVRLLVVDGMPTGTIFPDTAYQSTDDYYLTGKDSILVRNGTLKRDTFSFYLDSAFAQSALWPRRTPGNPTLMLYTDSLQVANYWWKPISSSCNKRLDDCTTMPDTIWPSSWTTTDTALIVIRPTCIDTTLDYCTATGWVDDSTHPGTLQKLSDTTRYNSWIYIESITSCQSPDSWKALAGTASAGRSVSLIRDIFIPSASETSCEQSGIAGWFLINAVTRAEIVDSTLVEAMLHARSQATIADTLP